MILGRFSKRFNKLYESKIHKATSLIDNTKKILQKVIAPF